MPGKGNACALQKNIQRKCDYNMRSHLVNLLGRQLEVGAVFIEGVLRHRDFTPEVRSEVGVSFGDLCKSMRYGEIIGVRKARTAANVAFKKLPIVAVEPFAWV